MKNVVIVSGARTPIGRYGGSLHTIPVYKFTSLVLNETVKRATVEPYLVDDVIMGQSYQNGECANGARMALLEAGWPHEVPGITMDRRCCSGLDAIFFGVMKIQTDNADIIVAGAMRLVTLLHEMKRVGSRYGLETICGGGGLGITAIVERV